MIIAMENSPFLMGKLTINGLPEGKRMFFHFGSWAILHCKTSMNVRGLDGPTRSCFHYVCSETVFDITFPKGLERLQNSRSRSRFKAIKNQVSAWFCHLRLGVARYMPRAMDITGRVWLFWGEELLFSKGLFCSS